MNTCLICASHLDISAFCSLFFFLGYDIFKRTWSLGLCFRKLLWWPSQVFLLPLGSLEELLGERGGWTCLKKLGPSVVGSDGHYKNIYIYMMCVYIFLLVQAECCWFCLIKLLFGNFSDLTLPPQVYSNLICHLVNIAKWLLNAFIFLIFLDHTLTFYCMNNRLYYWLWFHWNYLLYNFKLKTGLS